MGNFSIVGASCYNEADRHLVCTNIVLLLRDSNRVTPETDDKEALAHFDKSFCAEVRAHVTKTFGANGFPYRFILCLTVPFLYARLDYIVHLAVKFGIRAAIVGVLAAISTWVVLIPLALALSYRAGVCTVRNTGCRKAQVV